MAFVDLVPAGHGTGVGGMVLTRRDIMGNSLLGLLSGAAIATPIAPVSPRSLVQSVKLKIDDLVHAQVSKGITPGIAAAISKDGSVIHTTSAGVLDVKTNAPMLPTIPQHIGSIFKQFTATCILLLHQDGRLSIDDALSKHVPEISYGGRVRLRQMLNMVSGLSDNDPAIYGDGLTEPIARPAMLANLDKLPLMFEPGSKMTYTNTNYNLLGFIVERVSRMTYPDFLRKRIFGRWA